MISDAPSDFSSAPRSKAATSSSWPLPATVLGLIGLCLFTFFYALGGLPLLGPDEPRYAEIGREMWASGDYVSSRLSGYLWFEKPVLLYWGEALGFRLFGENEFGARFPSALAATLGVLFVFFAVRKLASYRAGVASAVVLATMGLFLGHARAASTDMVLAASMTLALLSGLLATRSSAGTRTAWLLACAAMTGAAMLAKGLVGVLHVALILGIYGALTKKFSFRRATEWLAGALVFALVIATWYLPVTLKHSSVFIDEFFVNHHFKRFLTNKYNHPQPFYFYFVILLLGALPWTALLIPTLSRLRGLRSRAQDSARDDLRVFAWAWLLVPLLFFSVSKSKLPSYILPIFPALAILFGLELERVWNGERDKLSNIAQNLTAGLLVLLSVGVAGYLITQKLAPGLKAVFACLPLVLALGGAILLARGKTRLAMWAPSVVLCSVLLVASLLVFPDQNARSAKSFAVQLNTQLRTGEKIAFFRKRRQYAPVFYNKGRFVFFREGRAMRPDELSQGDEIAAQTPSQLLPLLNQSPSLIVITDREDVGKLEGDARLQSQRLGEDRKHNLIALRVTKN